MEPLHNQILSKEQILQKTKRIAFEILENNTKETDVIIAGIVHTGYLFAGILKKELDKISPFKCTILRVEIQKDNLVQPVYLDKKINYHKSTVLILADDVLNTGKTLTFALKPFLEWDIKKIQVAVLIDRNYRNFPVSADYTGFSLSTVINDHIQVKLDNYNNFGVYLDVK